MGGEDNALLLCKEEYLLQQRGNKVRQCRVRENRVIVVETCVVVVGCGGED